ncbi:DUF2059 domain-containing protein [Parasulfuritortus cantonensis]|uniref:DUF2059 domain-containing protein n=1 Tax=Parasulfuritortus cantonensis TaxID=2528202 RepID=A0A4R1BGM5_9PROT|nr:DUF2059 domain-containing protein [Parasulfuritortus cantonensis]TCJ16304.1 DUF2059 domain-containing protein [Parasulfuritortus cantonensis]
MKALQRLLAVLFLVIAATASADELTAAKRHDIETLLDMTGGLAVGQQFSAAITKQLTETLKRSRPDIPAHVFEVLGQEVEAVFADHQSELKAALVPIYHEHFSAAEIQELIRFHSTAVGRKAIRVMPSLVEAGMQAGKRWGEALGPELNRRVAARLRSEGVRL